MTKYYTGTGDDGTTGILADKRVSKADALMAAIGDIDELNSAIGLALSRIDDAAVSAQLRSVQNNLFILGANLASANGKKIDAAQINPKSLPELEVAIKALGDKMPELRQFVLPGGSEASAALHLARSVARRAERSAVAAGKSYNVDRGVIAYLNRLSSYLFAAALYLNHAKGIKESHPDY